MNHDELKARVYEVPSSVYLMSAKTNDIYSTSNIYSKSTKNHLVESLVAVVDLHKEYVNPNILDTRTVCMHCSGNVYDVVYYPCLTIRVIENGLE